MTRFIFVLLAASAGFGCGVKGDPIAPNEPADMGRGKPTYRKALKKVKVNFQNTEKTVDESDDENDNEKDYDE